MRLGSTSTIDFYRHVIKRDATDAHYCVAASRCFTFFWGVVAIGFAALCPPLRESHPGVEHPRVRSSTARSSRSSLAGFFLPRIGGTAIFWGAIAAQALVLGLYETLTISYLWYNFIGPAACTLFSLVIQAFLGERPNASPRPPPPHDRNARHLLWSTALRVSSPPFPCGQDLDREAAAIGDRWRGRLLLPRQRPRPARPNDPPPQPLRRAA